MSAWHCLPIEVMELICHYILPLDGIVKNYQIDEYTDKLREYPYYTLLKAISPFSCTSQQYLYIFIECFQYDVLLQTYVRYFRRFSPHLSTLKDLVDDLQMGDWYTTAMKESEIDMVERVYTLVGVTLSCSNFYQHFRNETTLQSNLWHIAHSLLEGYLFFDRYQIVQSSSRPISQLAHKKCKEKIQDLQK